MTWDWFRLNYGTLFPAWWWIETGSCLILETLSWLYFQAVLFCWRELVLYCCHLCCLTNALSLLFFGCNTSTSVWSWLCSPPCDLRVVYDLGSVRVITLWLGMVATRCKWIVVICCNLIDLFGFFHSLFCKELIRRGCVIVAWLLGKSHSFKVWVLEF
jgi:hypothetical protein